MLKKSESLTIRLDAEQKTKLRKRCKGLDCRMSDYVLALVNTDLEEYDISMHKQPAQSRPELQREVVPGKIRKYGLGAAIPSINEYEMIFDDGTRHKIRKGRVTACKKPGENWCYFVES